jgi:hypothetical protein
MSEEKTEEVVEEKPQEETPKENPLYKTLFDVAEEATEEVEQEEERQGEVINLNEAVNSLDLSEPQEEEQKEEEPKEEAKQEEPEKAEPKKKKLRKVVDPDIPEDVAKQPAFRQQVDTEEPLIDTEEQEFIDTLIPEEKVVYEKILYADKKLGGEHKGKSKKFKAFLKKSKDYLDKKMAEDDFYDPSTDDQYKEFLQKNRPEFSRADEDKVYREMILEEADKRTVKRTNERVEELEAKLQRQEVQPRVNQAKANFRRVAQETVIPEEFRKTLSGGDEAIQQFAKENPFEYQILENFTQQLLTYSDALTDIFLDPTTRLDLENNQIHKDLNNWLQKEQESFIQSGQTEQEGKMFMRRERYYQMPEDKRSQYYTWSDNDLLKILAIRYQDLVNNALTHQRTQLEKAGYTKSDAQPVQQQAPVQTKEPAPKPPSVATTPRQGTTVDPKPQPKSTNNALLGALGL